MAGAVIQEAMVLAAGLGLRMRPLTATVPKPLLKVGGRALLDRALDALAAAGVTRCAVNAHWLGEQIEQHIRARSGPPACRVVHEDPVLETGGGIENALRQKMFSTPGPFFAVNADQVWRDGETPALTRLAAGWDGATMDALLLLQPLGRARGYEGGGDFLMNPNGTLRRGTGTGALVFTGVQVLAPRLFATAPGGAYSLNVLYEQAERRGRLFGLVHDGDWLHVGTPAQLAAADAYLAAHTPGVS